MVLYRKRTFVTKVHTDGFPVLVPYQIKTSIVKDAWQISPVDEEYWQIRASGQQYFPQDLHN
jgi:hypothetical protein